MNQQSPAHEETQIGAQKLNRHVDIIVALLVGGLALFVFATTFNDTYFLLGDRDEVRAVLVPRILLLAIMFLCAVLLLRTLLGRNSSSGSAGVDLLDGTAWLRLVGSLLVVVGVAATMQHFGFIPMMVIGICAQSVVLGFRRWRILFLVSTVAPFAVWYLIVQVAELSLPTSKFMIFLGF